MADMRCLGCGMREWHVAWTQCEVEVDDKPITFSMNLFKCNGCGQTSATPEVMQEFVEICVKKAQRKTQERLEE